MPDKRFKDYRGIFGEDERELEAAEFEIISGYPIINLYLAILLVNGPTALCIPI